MTPKELSHTNNDVNKRLLLLLPQLFESAVGGSDTLLAQCATPLLPVVCFFQLTRALLEVQGPLPASATPPPPAATPTPMSTAGISGRTMFSPLLHSL